MVVSDRAECAAAAHMLLKPLSGGIVEAKHNVVAIDLVPKLQSRD